MINKDESIIEISEHCVRESSVPGDINLRLCIASSYTAEPIKNQLLQDLQLTDIKAEIEFAPTNQLNHQLLSPNNTLTKEGVNVFMLRIEDLAYGEGFDSGPKGEITQLKDLSEYSDKITINFSELLQNIENYTLSHNGNSIMFITPPSPNAINQYGEQCYFDLTHSLSQLCESVAGLDLLVFSDFDASSVQDYYDLTRDSIGNIPYKPYCFDVMSSILSRRIYSLKQSLAKVIVLDADNTLWQGVCGEMPPADIPVSSEFRLLQEFMIDQRNNGMLLCIASKNDLEDVKNVFDKNNNMFLKWDDIIASRINWQPKSSNLYSLSKELNLSLNSFIFIDDNPVECAEVRSQHPEVLTVSVPANAKHIPQFLNRVKGFCAKKTTKEDANRSQLYKENTVREEHKNRFKSMSEFIDSLELQITFTNIKEPDIARVAQMTARTNQFNVFKNSRTEREVRTLLAQPGFSGIIANVSDRFGDYGTTALAILEVRGDVLYVETFLLSCRVLGRGVEYAMASKIGRLAVVKNIKTIVLPTLRTKKNRPAFNFLEKISDSELFTSDNSPTLKLLPNKLSILESDQNGKSIRIYDNDGNVPYDSTRDVNFVGIPDLHNKEEHVEENDAFISYLIQVFSQVCKIDERELSADLNYDALGINSFFIIEVTVKLEEYFGQLPPTLLLDYLNIRDLSGYFHKHHKEQVEDVLKKTMNNKHTQEPAKVEKEKETLTKVNVVEDPRRLSYTQEAMWTMHELEQAVLSHMIPLTLTIRKPIDSAALLLSFKNLISRHEVLRSRFVSTENGVELELRDSFDFSIPTVDLSSDSIKERGISIDSLKRIEVETPFDLSVDLPIRAKLIKIRESRHILLITLHHLVSDGWSIRVLFNDLSALYDSCITGTGKSNLADLPARYAEYAENDRQNYTLGKYQSQEYFWRDTLETAPAFLDIPTDYPRPDIQTFKTDVLHFNLSELDSDDLRSLSKECGASLYVTLLSAFGVVLNRYSRQRDMIIGSPIANRQHPEFYDLIGYFVNVVPHRLIIDRSMTFRELLSSVTESSKRAIDNGNLHFSKIVECLEIERDTSYSPLVQVLFALQNTPVENKKLLNSDFSLLATQRAESLFDLTLEVDDTGNEIKGRFEYNIKLFKSDTIEQFSDHFLSLLNGIILDPDSEIFQCDRLADEDVLRFERWNADTNHYQDENRLHKLFESQVETNPDKPGLIFETRDSVKVELSYKELNEGSNRLALYLISSGVQLGTPVGLLAEKSTEMIITALAILKAGGVVVLFDPELPSHRLAYLIENSGVNLIVFQLDDKRSFEHKKTLLSQTSVNEKEIQWISPDIENSNNLAQSDNPAISVIASNLACVIYTENDKGELQGCCISHQNVTGLIYNDCKDFSSARALLCSISLSYHAFLFDVLRSLVQGNTSNSAFSSQFAFHVGIEQKDFPVKLGSPVVNSGCYVLDDQLQLVPAGVIGELYLSGAGVPEAILNQPEVTAENIIPDDFSKEKGGRLYRTGNLVRYCSDQYGNITTLEYLGRRDNKDKVNKSRIALQALELLLTEHIAVDKIILVTREIGFEHQLICYVLPVENTDINQEQLSHELKSLIRNQSEVIKIPSAFVLLESLPLTPDNRIDKQALPVPESVSSRRTPYVAPQTNTENALVEIWQEKLGIKKIGIDDNYFVLGGDSIRSISLVTEANNKGLRFSTKDLFAQPTIKALATLIDQGNPDFINQVNKIAPFELLAPEEREILFKQYGEKILEDAYPLSMMQQGMVHLSIKQRHLNAYQNMHIYHFKDAWDENLFKGALAHLMNKHPMLRTVYHLTSENPLQLVLKEKEPEFTVVDISDRGDVSIQTVLKQWMKAEHAVGLDMSTSLWRLTIHLLNDNEFLFCMFIHHAQWDGWSLESFATELYSTYSKLRSNGGVDTYETLPSYNQFIAIEQKAIESKEQQEYWANKLEGSNLPWWTGKEKSPSATVECEVSLETSKKLTALASTLAVQEKSLWCSIYLALLAVLDGSDEVAAPVITQGRPEIPGGDKIVGVFLNALLLRVSIADKNWEELIKATDYELREQHGYRHYPLAEMQRTTGLDFSASVFTYTNWHVYYQGDEQNENNEVIHYSGEGSNNINETLVPQKIGVTQATNYLLSIYVSKDERTNQFSMSFTADTGVFDEEFRHRIQAYLSNIVREIENNIATRIDKNTLMGRDEFNQLLVNLNATNRNYQESMCVHHLFEELATNQQDAIALEFKAEGDGFHQVSYGELNARANQLARYLMKQGIGPEVKVGICVERSLEMIVGILGVLKAGGCYVPMDPLYPPARLEYILSQSACQIVLSEKHLLADLSFLSTVKSLPLDREIHALILNKFSRENIGKGDIGLSPDNLAYVIYTSGSTGEPKGVSITHKSLNNLATFQGQQYQFNQDSRILQFASLSFDAASWDWSMALLSGSVLHLIPEETVKSASQLNQIVRVYNITYSFIPPALLSLLNMSDFNQVKTITVGGESPSFETVKSWSKNRLLYNAYGPTENTVVSTTNQVTVDADRLLIGKPIENVTCYVFNSKKEVLPLKVVGELYLGGVGLSRGYVNEPGLTADRFVPHPYSEIPGERLYRTGDLVRCLPDAQGGVAGIEFIGRIDHQVKVRGFRIELGEIESVILGHELVKDVVVVAREDEQGNKVLVAYVVRNEQDYEEHEIVPDDSTALIYELRAQAQAQLPAYMVPSSIVVLKTFPLTPTGKVDRRALPEPELSFRQEYVPAEGQTEELLASLWCGVLKCERVSRFDNFFDLGGHSLLVTQLLSRIREEFAIEMAMRELFEQQTLQDQALVIDRIQQENTTNNPLSDNRTEKVKENRQSLDDYEGILEEGEI